MAKWVENGGEGSQHTLPRIIPSSAHNTAACRQRLRNSLVNLIHLHGVDRRDGLCYDEQVLENYARSLAGYSVITYLLGIGDRHLDNIMLQVRGPRVII